MPLLLRIPQKLKLGSGFLVGGVDEGVKWFWVVSVGCGLGLWVVDGFSFDELRQQTSNVPEHNLGTPILKINQVMKKQKLISHI